MNPDRHSPAGTVAHCPAVKPRSRHDGRRPSIGTCHAGCPRPGQRSEHDRWYRTAPSQCLVGLRADTEQIKQEHLFATQLVYTYMYIIILYYIYILLRTEDSWTRPPKCHAHRLVGCPQESRLPKPSRHLSSSPCCHTPRVGCVGLNALCRHSVHVNMAAPDPATGLCMFGAMTRTETMLW